MLDPYTRREFTRALYPLLSEDFEIVYEVAEDLCIDPDVAMTEYIRMLVTAQEVILRKEGRI